MRVVISAQQDIVMCWWVNKWRAKGITSELFLCKMKGIPEVKVSVVEDVTDGAVLLCDIVVRKLWQQLTEVLSLRIRQHFTPGARTHHREENVRLMKTKANIGTQILMQKMHRVLCMFNALK